MIESFALRVNMLKTIAKNDKNEYENKSYILKCPLFKKHKSFTFKKGINIIYAENGAGKSTLMKMLAVALACEQGGVSKLTNHWHRNLDETVLYQHSRINVDLKSEGVNYVSGHFANAIICDVKHDGQSAFYCDPKKLRGLTHRGAAFDYDFMDDFKKDGSVKGSTGRQNKSRMSDILDILSGKTDIIHEKIAEADGFNGFKHSEENDSQIIELISPSFEFGAKTLLIDEPESALDFYSHRDLFKLLKKNEDREDIQIIMISHSPLVFGLENAHFITDDEEKLNYQRELVKNGGFFNLNK